ncbi:acetyl/propionyl/methylcrotonyl-CoA carboxylase subunit alpha [Verminephrobacter eiseniae]|uniref:acetyl/propionyl/methylcrotonyl-CoA carboxylase subunit alpha n=1 Tax=Verminephrobacter eiseniae TaxID=364317 RepID=UPI0022375207|nr:biotin carboxylase N-terminal domain-containing protein [Verminephrobacter eiseniae]
MKKLLVANRGEIARRVIHTAHAMGIATVAVHSDPDAQALHVREATQAVALGGAASADSYLRGDKLLAAARATGADALHPGYGFLSENADFAQAVLDAGLLWVGPPPAAIRALGNKAAAKALAAAHAVPCLPGYAGADQSPERFAAEARRTGYPLMVKAVAGGGGRGLRLVTDAAQLPAALASARSEALAGFGCGDLLIERALLHPRHLEVQVFADAHGACIHLGERDCSVQRRHQKLIEESPSPAVDAALRERLGACAVALARAAGYVGAGTVEFLLEEGQFFLLEMNTRLQVEHPVTEALAGLDLVEWQLRVARGEPLALAQHQVALQGHAIEVRLYAEDAQFQPHTGRVLHWSTPPATLFGRAASGALRIDHALEPGSDIPPHYDAMLGKLIMHAPTREQAIAALVRALDGTSVLGLPTNRALLAACLDHPRFRSGQALVSFLREPDGALHGLRQVLLKNELQVIIPSALSAIYAENAAASALPCGLARPLQLRHQGQLHRLTVRECGAGRLQIGQAGSSTELWLTPQPDGSMRCTLARAADGAGNPDDPGGPGGPGGPGNDLVRMVHDVRAVPVGALRWHWQAGSVDGWVQDASWEPATGADAGTGLGAAGSASELRAPCNGRVLALPASVGQALAAGETVVVIESMKLEHCLACPDAATLAELLVGPGQQVSPGQVLARFAAAAALPPETAP